MLFADVDDGVDIHRIDAAARQRLPGGADAHLAGAVLRAGHRLAAQAELGLDDGLRHAGRLGDLGAGHPGIGDVEADGDQRDGLFGMSLKSHDGSCLLSSLLFI